MTFYTHVREDSNFVYGKLYELLELLNNNDLRFYVKNDKKINLFTEFKYKKKKRVEFVGALDYFGSFDDKESEFVVFPIIFNDEYELLYLGASIFFKDSFSYCYKKEKYNYLELYIRNVAKSINSNKNKTPSNGSNQVDEEDEDYISINYEVLINLRNLKAFNEQEHIKRKIPPSNDTIGTETCNVYDIFKERNIFVMNRNDYTDGSERRIIHLDVYSGEYLYENNSSGYSNSHDNSTNYDKERILYLRGNRQSENQDMILSEKELSRNNEMNEIEHTKQRRNDCVYSSEKREDLQNGHTTHDGHYKFGKTGNATNNNIHFEEHYENLKCNSHVSSSMHKNEFVEPSKGRHMPNEDLFPKSSGAGLIGNMNEEKIKKEKEESKSFTIFSSGHYSSKGNRTYNEDRVINIENIREFLKNEMNEINERKKNDDEFDKEYEQMLLQIETGTGEKTPSYAYCAIYDGHNGENAVNTVQKYLHLNIYMYFLNGNGISDAIKCGFKSIDKRICECTSNCEEDNHSNYSSGTTACVTIVLKNMLYIGNIGDSRCVLSKNGRAVVLTVDHRASVNKKEQNRIIGSGGTLDDEGYLGGCLGVCRGFGSFEKKTKVKLKGLICDPDIFQIKLTDDDEFLIICCDGIFDVMTSQEAVNTVRMSLVQNANAHAAAEGLCNLAYSRKSLDNLSVVVVVFQNPANKKKASSNENTGLHSVPSGRVRRRIPFSALKSLLNP